MAATNRGRGHRTQALQQPHEEKGWYGRGGFQSQIRLYIYVL